MHETPADPEQAHFNATIWHVVSDLAADLDGRSRAKLAGSLIDAATLLLVKEHGRDETAAILGRLIEREIKQLGSCMRWQLV